HDTHRRAAVLRAAGCADVEVRHRRVRHNRGMSEPASAPEPALAPRNPLGAVIGVWVVALLASIAIGIFVPDDLRVSWLLVAFGWVVLLSFAVQLWYGRTEGFIVRVAGSVIGALFLLGVISAGFALAALAPA